jgi:hypothetical protein
MPSLGSLPSLLLWLAVLGGAVVLAAKLVRIPAARLIAQV